MGRKAEDEEREERIQNEIVVDAYDGEEQAIGWYTYLQDTLQFPFAAQCIKQRVTSPLQVGDVVQVVGMATDDECVREMFVTIAFEDRTLAVPLMQLDVLEDAADAETLQAVGDWHYWVEQGYEF
jgi:hypothetical protein